MTISSRTPEGEPTRCPVYRQEVCVEPSFPYGDAPCPHCGQLLVYVTLDDETLLAKRPPASNVRQSVLEILAEHWKVPQEVLAEHPAFQKQWDGDSLDLVELIMELEDEFGTGAAA